MRERIDVINQLLLESEPKFYAQYQEDQEIQLEILNDDIETAIDSVKFISEFSRKDWFDYSFYGEYDPYFYEDMPLDVDLETENDIFTSSEFVTQIPEVRQVVDEKEDEKWDAILDLKKELLREISPRLEGCRYMVVKTKRGGGLYEYISIRNGPRIETRRGNWYYFETRYPIVRNEMRRSNRKGALEPDIVALEELGRIGIDTSIIDPSMLVEICKNDADYISRRQ